MDAFKNFAIGTVSTGYDAAATSIVMTTGHAARFPATPFYAIWWNSTDFPAPWNDPNVEVVRATNLSTETFTITRAEQGSSASTKNTAAKVYLLMQGWTKGDIDQIATELALKAALASPTFTGVPAAPTASAATSTTQIATTAFVTTADNLKANIASPTFTGTPAAPTAAADTSTTQIATTEFVTTEDNLKADLASPTFTGTPVAPTASAATNTTQIATTAFVQGEITAKAPLASPTFTGNPVAPTPAANDNDTSIATTAYVQTELTAYASDSVDFTNKTVNGLTITTSTGTLTVANGKTLTASNSLTLVGTDATTLTFPAETCDVGFRGIPQNSKSAAYTTVLADAGKHILHPTADNNARTFTIDSNANVAYPIGTAITFINQINTVTIAITSDTLTLAGAGTTGSRTLGPNGLATAVKIGTTDWIISGGSALT